MKKSLVLFLVMLSFNLSYSQLDTVAVLPFSISGDAEIKVADAMRDIVESILIQKKICNAVERKQIDKIINEYKFQESGLTSTPASIGKLLNVAKVITGKLIKLDRTYTIAIEEVDVKTGE